MMNIKLLFLVSSLNLGVALVHAEPESLSPAQNMLHQAVLANSPEGIQRAIDMALQQGDEAKKPMFLLLKAIMDESTGAIREAMKPIIEQGKDTKSPLLWAVLLLKAESVKALIECGAKVDYFIERFAVKMGGVKTALVIIKGKANINFPMDDYMKLATRCYYNEKSCRGVALELIQELINRGYDINKMWDLNIGAVGFFDSSYPPDIRECLIKNGINVNYTWEQEHLRGSSFTPLVTAVAYGGSAEKVKFLLDAGADVNQKANLNSGGELQGFNTPLAFAINSNSNAQTKAGIVALLLEHGANLE